MGPKVNCDDVVGQGRIVCRRCTDTAHLTGTSLPGEASVLHRPPSLSPTICFLLHSALLTATPAASPYYSSPPL
eukprot:6470589-Amphidinium_carterae.1